MNSETKHSPLPWEAEAPSLVVLDAYGNVVAGERYLSTFMIELGPQCVLGEHYFAVA